MGPRLLCGLASGASLLLIVPVQAKVAPPAKLQDIKAKPPENPAPAELQTTQRFREGIADIIAQKPPAPGAAWSDIDRDRLADHFRLPDGRDDGGEESGPMVWSVTGGTMERLVPHRGVSLVVDGGAPSLAPTETSERSGRLIEYEMSAASACAGLMPTVACTSSVNGDDSMVRLAFAYNF